MAKNIVDEQSELVQPEESSKPKIFIVQFKYNRAFELHVGRKMFYFDAYGHNELTESEINHPDFIQQSGNFNIKEI